MKRFSWYLLMALCYGFLILFVFTSLVFGMGMLISNPSLIFDNRSVCFTGTQVFILALVLFVVFSYLHSYVSDNFFPRKEEKERE